MSASEPLRREESSEGGVESANRERQRILLFVSLALPTLAAAGFAVGAEAGVLGYIAQHVPVTLLPPIRELMQLGLAMLIIGCSVSFAIERCRQCDWKGPQKLAPLLLGIPILCIMHYALVTLATLEFAACTC